MGFIVGLVGLLGAVLLPPVSPTDTLEVFVSWGCPHCAAAKPFVERLRGERPDLTIVMVDVAEVPAARERLIGLARASGITTVGVPAFHVRGQLIIGWDADGRTEAAVRRALTAPADSGAVRLPLVGRVSADRLGLPAFSFALGFVDGVNPCAMWALLYVLTLLVTLRDRRKMLLLGGTFVAVGGLLYFAFIAAWLELFLLVGVSRPLQAFLGGAAVLAGGFHLKDGFVPGRGPSLAIPESAKPRLQDRARRIITAENLPGALIAVAMLSVLVNVVELLCTAGIPAVYTQVLATRDLSRVEYYGNLAIYILAYVLDDAIVLGVVVTTLSRKRLQERAGRRLNLVSGSVLTGLGLVLLFRPSWLR
ncbi:MAG: thioredoxin family protein [Gemmatimonadetes bacterium]|nr:thioredoxin family protein [Gemmatimonadota bacterium]